MSKRQSQPNSKISDFRPQQKNANTHTSRGLGALDNSMAENGWIGAMTVAADGETFDGSARLETAYIRFGDDVEPIVIESDGTRPVILKRTDIPNASDPRAKKLALAANRIAELDLNWDADLLAELSQELDISDLFSEAELNELLEGLKEIEEDQPHEEDEEEVANLIDRAESGEIESRVSVNQVWKLGRHYICCADSTKEENARTLMKIAKVDRVDMCFSDAPYGIAIVSTNESVGRGNCNRTSIEECREKKRLGTVGGSKPFGSKDVRGSNSASNIVNVNRYAPIIGDDSIDTAVNAYKAYSTIAPDAVHIWWGGNYFASALPDSSCWIVWDKENTGDFADAELAWTNQKTAVRIFKHVWNGMIKASEKGDRRVHPSQKPKALFRWCAETYGKAGDVVIDPFLGSGMSLLSAEEMNDDRAILGFEMSEEYCEVICQRFEKISGIEPMLVGTL